MRIVENFNEINVWDELRFKNLKLRSTSKRQNAFSIIRQFSREISSTKVDNHYNLQYLIGIVWFKYKTILL